MQTSPAGAHSKASKSKPERLPLHGHLGHLLRRAHQRDRSNFVGKTRGLDVTPQQYAVLLTLAELGPTSQREVCEHAAMEPGNLHNLLRRIEERRLIAIRCCPHDRRRNELHLTTRGSELLDELRPGAEAGAKQTLAMLSSTEQRQLLTLLEKVAMAKARGSDD